MKNPKHYLLMVCILMLALKPTYAVDSLELKGDELQRVPAEWFTLASVDWLLDWRQKHFSILSQKNEVLVMMIVRFGIEPDEKIESIAISEVRPEGKSSLNEPLSLSGYRVIHVLTGKDKTTSTDKVVERNAVQKVISSLWELVSSAKIDSQAIRAALGKNEIWYCVSAEIDAEGWMTSTRQLAQAYNPSREGVLWQLRNELLKQISR